MMLSRHLSKSLGSLVSRNARFFSSVNPSVDTDDVNSVLFGSAKKPKVDSSSSAGSSIAHQTDLFVNEALEVLDFPARMSKMLLAPQRIVHSELVITLDNGEIAAFNAWRVQHDDSRGPFKGGFRFHPSADLEDSKSLASLMTWKLAVMGIPFGGAKGGVKCDPSQLSERELERLTRRLVQMMKDVMGPYADIPGPEMSTGSKVMSWFFDEFSKYKGFSPACVTGKPVELFGSKGREYATGRGVVLATREALRLLGLGPLKNKRCVVQGFGNVGSWAATLLHLHGAKVIAVSDRSGAIYNENGLDIQGLRRHMKASPPFGGHLESYPDGVAIDKDSILNLECDVLIPASVSGVITEDNAHKLNCKVLAEAANGPVTFGADAILRDRGIDIIPDIVANGGGVTVSFYEWVQNLQQLYWEEYEVNTKLDRQMEESIAKCWKVSETRKLPLRTACYANALQTVLEAHLNRGFD